MKTLHEKDNDAQTRRVERLLRDAADWKPHTDAPEDLVIRALQNLSGGSRRQSFLGRREFAFAGPAIAAAVVVAVWGGSVAPNERRGVPAAVQKIATAFTVPATAEPQTVPRTALAVIRAVPVIIAQTGTTIRRHGAIDSSATPPVRRRHRHPRANAVSPPLAIVTNHADRKEALTEVTSVVAAPRTLAPLPANAISLSEDEDASGEGINTAAIETAEPETIVIPVVYAEPDPKAEGRIRLVPVAVALPASDTAPSDDGVIDLSE